MIDHANVPSAKQCATKNGWFYYKHNMTGRVVAMRYEADQQLPEQGAYEIYGEHGYFSASQVSEEWAAL